MNDCCVNKNTGYTERMFISGWTAPMFRRVPCLDETDARLPKHSINYNIWIGMAEKFHISLQFIQEIARTLSFPESCVRISRSSLSLRYLIQLLSSSIKIHEALEFGREKSPDRVRNFISACNNRPVRSSFKLAQPIIGGDSDTRLIHKSSRVSSYSSHCWH